LKVVRSILALICSQIVSFVISLLGIYLAVAAGYGHAHFYILGPAWASIAAYMGCMAGALIAPREYWRLILGICALALIAYALPFHPSELSSWLGFLGAIAASAAAYFTASFLFSAGTMLPARQRS
jgi:hypothetical protein